MDIQVNTDGNVVADDALIRHVQEEVAAGLSRYSDQLTRLEVHLGDESSGRDTAGDKRCLLEARPSGQAPVTVTDHADTLEDALTGTIHKLQRLLETKFDRLGAREARGSVRHQREADDAR